MEETLSTASPCTGVCKIGTRGYCSGCGRYRHEIADWNQKTDEEKQNVNRRAKKRLDVEKNL